MKCVVREHSDFRSTRSGTTVLTKGMADFETVKSHLTTITSPITPIPNPPPSKHIKAVIRHLPRNTPAEDISDGLVNLGFDAIIVKQTTMTHRSHSEGTTTGNLPLFLVYLPRTAKSQEVFNLPSLCYIAIRVEATASNLPIFFIISVCILLRYV
jgi:hypothetical protein